MVKKITIKKKNSFFEDLTQVFSGDISRDEETRNSRSRDASIFRVVPEAVLFPRNTKDVENLVSLVSLHSKSKKKYSVAARSQGTCMSGGSLSESLVLDMSKYMCSVGPVIRTHISAQPGAPYRNLERKTLEKGLLLPSYTASKEICGIGGMVGNNSGGEKTLRYGKVADYVEKLQVVLSDGKTHEIRPLTKKEFDAKIKEKTFEGELYKKLFSLIKKNHNAILKARPNVSKNSTGYALWDVWDGKKFDLTRLLVGAQGTLGIVTEVEFRLVPVQTHSRLLVIFLDDLHAVSDVVNTMLPLGPESLESFDDNTLSFAFKYIGSILKRMKFTNLISLALSFLPELRMILTGGMPKLILLVEFGGQTEEETLLKLKRATEAASSLGVRYRVAKSHDEEKKYWTIRRESFNLLREHTKGKRTAPFIDDIVVRPEYLPEFLPKLTEILDRHKLLYTVAGHVGDGNFHIIPLMDMKNPDIAKVIRTVSEEVFDLVVSYKGSISGEHNDGIIRTPYLSKMYDKNILALFQETKNIFDPLGIFNPGKKVSPEGGYIDAHIVHE